MIPSLSDLLVVQSKIDAQRHERSEWLLNRQTAVDYYYARTQGYTESYFSGRLMKKIPSANVNVTRRVIDRTSLVYMVDPIRTVDEARQEDYDLLTQGKTLKFQRAERFTNLLGLMYTKLTWRNNRFEYDLIRDFELEYGDDPLIPIAIHYPLSVKSTVTDTTPELWAYWDDENTFVYDKTGKKYPREDNPDMVNPYGILPFLFSFRDGIPETCFTDVDVATDLIQTNLMVNVAETNKMANIHFQSFGRGILSAAGDTSNLPAEQDMYWKLDIGDTATMLAPPNTVDAVTNGIESWYKMLALNYHLSTAFVEGTTAESGVALRMRNQELTDDRRSDVERWRQFERDMFEIERVVAKVEANIDLGDEFSVDFNEAVEVKSPQEKREEYDWKLANGMIDVADILMIEDPDKFPERKDAEEYLAERKKTQTNVRLLADQPEGIFDVG